MPDCLATIDPIAAGHLWFVAFVVLGAAVAYAAWRKR